MIHAQQRREPAAGSPGATSTAEVAAPRSPDSPDVTGSEAVVPAQQKRRPDAYDLYAEIFAIRTEGRAS